MTDKMPNNITAHAVIEKEDGKEYITADGRVMREIAPHQFVNKKWLIANGYVVHGEVERAA